MKSLKRFLAVMLTVAMILSVTAFAADFKDVEKNNQYEEAITLLSDLGVINGYDDGTFKPDKEVTRAEMTTLLMRMLGLSKSEANMPNSYYTDTVGHWAVYDINTATDKKIINGYGNGIFQGVPDIFAPFHGADAVSVQIVLPADVPQVVGRSQAVHIKMEQGQSAGQVFIDDGVGRAGDHVGTAKTFGKATGECGFAGAKVSLVGQDRAGGQYFTQGGAQFFSFRRGIGDECHRLSSFKVVPSPGGRWQP